MQPAPSPDGRHSLSTATWLPIVCGAVVGLVALQLPVDKPRWLVAALIGALASGVALVVRNQYRLHLAVFIFSIQLCVWLTFFFQGATYYGASGATGLEIYLPSILGVAVLIARFPDLRRHGQPLRFGPEITKPTLVMAVPILFSVLLSTERVLSVFTVVNVAQWYFMYLVALNLIRSESDLRLAVRMIMVVAIFQSLAYAMEYATGVTITLTGEVFEAGGVISRHGGTVGTHPSTYAEFMNPLVTFTTAFFLAPEGTGMRRWSRIAAPAAALGILMSFTRAAWIGCALGLIVLIWTGIKRGWIKPRRIALLAAAGVVLVIVFAPQIALVFGKDHQNAIDERVMLQGIAMNIIRAHPITGIGIGAYSSTFHSYVSSALEENWLFVVHNVYLLRAAETGVLGAIAFIAWLWAGMRLAYERMDSPDPLHARLGLGCLTGFIALAFQFWWDTGTGFSQHALQWFLLGMLVSVKLLDEEAAAADAPLVREEPRRALA